MKYITLAILTILSIIILRINFKLHTPQLSRNETKEDIILQLNFLESELKDNNLGGRMQNIFPEGFVFVNALYGLTWCELASVDSLLEKEQKAKAISEALYVYEELDSPRAKSTFNNYLNPEYGIFYAGWKNYLLSKILSVDSSFVGADKYITAFNEQSKSIVVAMNESDIPYLESYGYQSWPADMLVAMASISNYNKLYGGPFAGDINAWINNLHKGMALSTSMIPHKVDSKTGEAIEGVRGCSMGLVLRMLSEIDKEFAKEQYYLYDSLFISKRFGLPSVREYPLGRSGLGDLDSGPVIFGVGFTATIVMIGSMALNNEVELANRQYKTIHAFGFDRTNSREKKYLFGKLPMGDAFIAWGRASGLNSQNEIEEDNEGWWRAKFHGISFILLLFFLLFYYRKPLLKKVKQQSLKTTPGFVE